MEPRHIFLRTLLDMSRASGFCTPPSFNLPALSGTTVTEAVVRWTALELVRYLYRSCTEMCAWYPIQISILRYGANGEDSTRFTLQWLREQIVVTTVVSRSSDGRYILVIEDPQRNSGPDRWSSRVSGSLRFEGTAYVEKRPFIHTDREELNCGGGRVETNLAPVR
jgi:hypothetical protein